MNISKLKDRSGTMFKVKLKKSTRAIFCNIEQNRIMYGKLGNIWEVCWNEEQRNFQTAEYSSIRSGWYITPFELENYFELVEEPVLNFIEMNEKIGTIVIEKAVVINDMRVTSENMEEFFENVRKMLA